MGCSDHPGTTHFYYVVSESSRNMECAHSLLLPEGPPRPTDPRLSSPAPAAPAPTAQATGSGTRVCGTKTLALPRGPPAGPEQTVTQCTAPRGLRSSVMESRTFPRPLPRRTQQTAECCRLPRVGGVSCQSTGAAWETFMGVSSWLSTFFRKH